MKYLSLPRSSIDSTKQNFYPEKSLNSINPNKNSISINNMEFKDDGLDWENPFESLFVGERRKNKVSSNAKRFKNIMKRSKSLTKSYINELWKRANFRIYAFVTLIQTIHCHFNTNYFPLFLSILFHNDQVGKSAWLLVISFILPHVLNLYNLKLVERHGSYQVITIMFMLKILAGVILYTATINQQSKDYHVKDFISLTFLMAYIIFNRVLTEGICKLLTLPLADLCDEDRITKGRHASAALTGTISLFSKPGEGIAPLLGHFLLSNDQSKENVLSIMYLVPIFIGVLQCLLWSQYNLHKTLRNYI